MSILRGLMGTASEVDLKELAREFEPILISDETIDKAYKMVRELIVFTNKRMILVDKQGVTGKKASYHSVPYRSVVQFAKERRGHLDMDAEIKIWVRGEAEPILKAFKNDQHIDEVYQVLSQYVLN